MSDVDLTENGDQPVLTTIAAMTAVSLENTNLAPRELMLARIAALAAVGAPPMSYLVNIGAASDMGVTPEDVQGVLVAVAPIIGTPRVTLAAGNVLRALGLAITVAEADLEEQLAASTT